MTKNVNAPEDLEDGCIGYCDPQNKGVYPHPAYPGDKLCDECWHSHGAFFDEIESKIHEWVGVLGEEQVKELIRGIL